MEERAVGSIPHCYSSRRQRCKGHYRVRLLNIPVYISGKLATIVVVVVVSVVVYCIVLCVVC